MATNTDTAEYTSYDTKGKLLKSATLPGKAGKQIRIEATTIQLYSGKDKVINNTVLAINGVAWAAWNWDIGKYSEVKEYKTYPSLVDTGKDAVLTWIVKATDSKIAAKIKNITYTFSYVDVATPEPVPETKNPFVVIECTNEEKAKTTVEEIKAKGILSDDMKIYIAKSV